MGRFSFFLLLLTGEHLITLGLEPGPALGKLLAAIRENQLQDALKALENARE